MWIRLILILMLMMSAYAEPHYYLCGPDEDGCSPDEYPYCLCMPQDEGLADKPYCLDFDIVACIPLSKQPHCPKGNIFANQSTCLAVAFQSEPDPPCPLVPEQFCRLNHIPFCKPDGGMRDCVIQDGSSVRKLTEATRSLGDS